MILTCTQCGARYRFDEMKMAGDSALVRCRKCKAEIPVNRSSSSTPTSPSVPTGKGPATPPASAVSGRTALLADEAREFREFVRGELQAAGYEVSMTESGEEALLLAGSHPFDLIVLNAYLRRLLGIQVCERIKSDPALKATPVILMGALLDPNGGGGGPQNRYGADEFISTSISREDLAARIARFSRGKAPAPGLATIPTGQSAPVPRGSAASSSPPAGQQDPARGGGAPAGDEAEIRRLARIMISDIEIYHPEKFSRALRDGTFFEAFAEELARGKELIDRRFGHLSNRIQILAAGLRDSLEPYRGSGSKPRSSFG
jgi:predicted Zn finger-like uncharacterized protein